MGGLFPGRGFQGGLKEREQEYSLIDQTIPVVKRIRPIELADKGGVRYQPGLGMPAVKLIGRGLHDKLRGCFGTEVECHLMRGAGRGGSQSTCPAHLDRSVQMTAKDALDLRVLPDDVLESFGILEADVIHMADKGLERRVVHEDDRRPVGSFVQLLLQPREARAT